MTSPSDTAVLDDLRLGDLGAALALSQAEEWPHRAQDWRMLFDLGEGVVARAEGEVVATGLLLPCGPHAATCGMIIVSPRARGRGLGRRVMEALLARAGGRSCRLVATPAGLPLYRKLGFEPRGRIFQHQGIVRASVMAEPGGIDAAGPGDLETIIALDHAATRLERHGMLTHLSREARLFVRRKGAAILGYGACRPFGRGHLLGPIVARDETSLHLLLATGIARHIGDFLRIDLTGAGAQSGRFLEAAGLLPAGGGTALVRAGSRAPEATDPDVTCYALASQTLC